MSSRYRRNRSPAPPRKRSHQISPTPTRKYQKGIAEHDEFTKAYELLSIPSELHSYDALPLYPSDSERFPGHTNNLSYDDGKGFPEALMDVKIDRRRERSRSPRRRSGSRNKPSRGRSRSRGRDRRSMFEPPERFVPESKSNRYRPTDVIEQGFSRKENESEYGASNNRFSPPKLGFENVIYDSRPKLIDSGKLAGMHGNEQLFMEDKLISGLPSQTSLFGKIQGHPQNERFHQNFIQGEPAFISDTLPSVPTNFNDSTSSGSENPLIPEFNPDTTKLTSKMWIELIENVSNKLGWKLDEKQYIMTSRLTGFASQWYLSSGINYKSWDTLVKGFLMAFPSKKEYYELLKSMMVRTKSKEESISDYFHHKVALLNACEIFGSKAVSCIIGGLTNEKLKEDAIQQTFSDPDALYLYLRPTDMNAPKPKPSKTPPRTRPPKVKKIKERMENKVCYSCSTKGHIQANCPASKPNSGADNHLKSLDETLSELPLERITDIKIYDTTLRAYIDRSSESTTIQESVAKSLNLPIQKQFRVIRGFNNDRLPSFGFVDTPLSVDRAAANTTVFVVRNEAQPLPLILGKSFLEQRHIYVMNSEAKMRIYQKMDNGTINFDF